MDFANIGAYRSALKTDSEINIFLKKKLVIRTNLPVDFYFLPEGMLDSPAITRMFDDMENATYKNQARP